MTRTEEFAPGRSRRRSAPAAPAIIELQMDPEMITTRQTLSEIRAAAMTAR